MYSITIELRSGQNHNLIKMDRSRGWVFTLNNYNPDDELWAYDLSLCCVYVVVGKEIADSGTPHLQGFCYFANKKSLSQMKDSHASCHWEPQRGSNRQAADYCKKDGDYFESGECPKEKGGESEKERWELALGAYAAGDYASVPADILIRYGHGLDFAVKKLTKFDLTQTTTPMEWYYGDSGTGKSRRARDENPGAYLKMANKWWDGYAGEDTVIIEDFDVAHSVLCHHLKIWLDRYPFPAEVKGAKIDIRPKKIIITSNYHPSDIWTTKGDLEPILRRLKITHFNTLFV